MSKMEMTASPPNGTDQPQVVTHMDPGQIVRSPFNKRRIELPQLTDLVASIEAHGIIEPLIARRDPGGAKVFELIAGERRWRAAQQIKLRQVPVIIREATDREAIEIQTIENEHRADLTPIEKAEKYHQLLEEYKKTGITGEKAIDLLAEKVGRKRSAVYEMLRLVKLPESIRKAVSQGKLPHTQACYIAQLDGAPEIQERLLRQIVVEGEPEDDPVLDRGDLFDATRDDNGVLSARDTKRLVSLELALAKPRSEWEKTAEEFRKKGGRVLTEQEHEGLFNMFDQVKAPWLNGEDSTADFNRNYTHQKWITLMGKHAPAKVLAHNDKYKPLWLYDRKAALKAVAENGHKRPKRQTHSAGGNDSYAAREAKRKEKAARMAPVAKAATKLLMDALESPKAKLPWDLFVGAICSNGDLAPFQAIAERHGWKVAAGEWKAAKEITAKTAKLPLNKLIPVLFEIILINADPWQDYSGRWDADFVKLCTQFKIDLAKIEKEMAPAPEPKPAKPKVQASGKRKAKAAKGKGAKR